MLVSIDAVSGSLGVLIILVKVIYILCQGDLVEISTVLVQILSVYRYSSLVTFVSASWPAAWAGVWWVFAIVGWVSVPLGMGLSIGVGCTPTDRSPDRQATCI